MKKTYLQLITGVSLLFAAELNAQNSCVPCGTGNDGAYTASANTTLIGGTYNYTTFTINPGVIVTVTGTQPLIIRCTGAVVINGGLDVTGGNGTNGITFSAAGTGGIGVAGGENGGDGTYSTSLGGMLAQNGLGAGGANTAGNGWSGGGGAGYSSAGSASGGVGGFAGPTYGNAQLSAVLGGSGGGGGSGGFSCGSGGGGAGGGYVEITSCVSITIDASGVIRANGGAGGSDGAGNCGGGGGGSGGTIKLGAPAVGNYGQIRALGGNGGASAIPGSPYFGIGGNGGNGRIRIDGVLTGSGTIFPASIFTSPILAVTVSTPGDTICTGGSTTFSAAGANSPGPYTYNWMPGNINTSSITVSPTASTVYTVTVTDSANCSSTDTVGVVVNPLPTVSLGNDTAFCQNPNPYILTAQTSGFIYLWSTGATSPSIPVSSSGMYWVDVTNNYGCVGSDTTSITINPPPVISFVPAQDSFCLTNGPVGLTATPAGGTYSGPGMSGNTFTALTAGVGVHTITYAYVDSLGCSAISSVLFTVDVCTDFATSTAQTIFTATPNPSNGLFVVNVSLPGTLVVYTIEGREVYRVQHNAAGRSDVDLSAYGSGIYLLRYVYEGGQAAARVSVQ